MIQCFEDRKNSVPQGLILTSVMRGCGPNQSGLGMPQAFIWLRGLKWLTDQFIIVAAYGRVSPGTINQEDIQ